MGFKGLFIKEEEQQQEKPKEVAPTVASVMPIQTPTITTGTGEVDKEIETKIWEMIVAKNLPGPDYIEFKNVASGLTEIVPDENLRMKGAFNVLLKSYPNFTKEIILNSIDTYIGIVGEEKEKGRTECEELRRTSSADILRQIEELKKKSDAINQETLELEEEIRKSSEEIDRKERVFESSVQSVINTLESDKTRVTNLSL